jgi:hypothetical protein
MPRPASPRTPRTVQRYCGNEHLCARRIKTEFGEKFLITRAFVQKHIAYIKELGVLLCHDPKRAISRPGKVEINRGVAEKEIAELTLALKQYRASRVSHRRLHDRHHRPNHSVFQRQTFHLSQSLIDAAAQHYRRIPYAPLLSLRHTLRRSSLGPDCFQEAI